MDIDPVSVLIAALAGMGIFSIAYFALRLALKDHEEDKERKRLRP
jgi:hypothetical protein